jgi:type I restriction enzyme, S subunit
MCSNLTLSEVCDELVDCVNRTAPESADGDFFAVGTPAMRGNSIDLSQARRISREVFGRWTRRLVPREGDLLLAREAPMGPVVRIPPGGQIAAGQRTMHLRANPTIIHPGYLYYLLISPLVQNQLLTLGMGSTVSHLRVADVKSFRLPLLPRLDYQDAVQRLLGAIDDKIAANDLIGQTSRAFMAATYAVALANGAVTREIGEVAAIFDGPHATPKKTDAGPWFLSISSLQDGRVILNESAHLSESDFEHWTRRVTPSAGDLLFSYETRLGEAALMPSGVRGCLGRRMAILRPRPGAIGSCVLAEAFRSDSFQRTIRQRAIHGATVDRIPLVDLPSWPIEVPLNSDGQLESTLADIDERVEQAERESASLAQLRDTLLPLLMSGKVRVRDIERRVEDAL